MKKIPAAVERLIKKLGEPVTVQIPSQSFYDTEGEPISTYAIIDTQNVSIGEGRWDRVLVATLPRLSTELAGATLTRTQSGETFNVGIYEKTYAGGNVAMQEVILKAVS
jgi:hypothetical protein